MNYPNTSISQPSQALYTKVRAAFVGRETTLSAWCRENNVKRQNARQALVGAWNGPKAVALRESIFTACGISHE
jgi:hypothetical protein